MVKKLLFFIVFIAGLNGFSQTKSFNDLSASPNPFKNQTTITFFSENASDVILSVQNVLGKTVYRERFIAKKGKNSIPFFKNNLNKGVYLYSIQQPSGILTKRFVIQ